MKLVNIDFQSKLRQDFLNFFEKEEYNNREIVDLFHLYCNKINKQFSKNTYNVFISKELIHVKNSKKNILMKIKKDFENNNINLLNKRLSKGSIKEDENDLLLNNWGIYHLHLGVVNENEFSGRTGLLLFIKVINNKVYFLDLKEHGNFSSIDFIKIMHNNWEEEIKLFRVKNFTNIEPKLNEKEVYKLWKVGINAILTFNDTNNIEVAYYPISGGINVNKTPTFDTVKWISLSKSLVDIDQNLNSKCYLRLNTKDKKFYIEDESNNVLYEMNL